jgi:hypothetical protein
VEKPFLKKLAGHIVAMIIVTLVLCLSAFIYEKSVAKTQRTSRSAIAQYDSLIIAEPERNFSQALLSDVLSIYSPEQQSNADSLASVILEARRIETINTMEKSHVSEKLSASRLTTLSVMYLKFLCMFAVVMLLTFYGVQTLAIVRFIRYKAVRTSTASAAKKIVLKIGNFLGLMVLFSPAYVIAYCIRTDFNTDSFVFMIVLAFLSNGLLVTYANKFYAFLISESRKGYVETALVKNLQNSYVFGKSNGIALNAIFNPVHGFKGHVFSHIFANARINYLGTLKEQATFLITGLIIIEMALNMHGYLSYELLRQLLWGNTSIVVAIVCAIFYTVKLTEIFADWFTEKEWNKYANLS